MVCSINSVFTPRLEPQHPLATAQDKADEPEPRDQDDPHFGTHPRGKGARPRDHAIDAAAKAIAARRQRLFILPGEDQSLFRRRWHDAVVGGIVGLFDHKTAIVPLFGGKRRCGNEQVGSGKNAEAHHQGPHQPFPYPLVGSTGQCRGAAQGKSLE
jgi:hypothetical protein